MFHNLNWDFADKRLKPLQPVVINTDCPAVRAPWAAYRLGDHYCILNNRRLEYVSASLDPLRGMWGDGVGANVDRSNPETIDLDDYGSSMVFHVVLHSRTSSAFQTLCNIGFGGSDLLLRTGAAGNVRIQLTNVLGGAKTYDGALSVSAGDKVSYTGLTSVSEDFFCVVVNHTTGESVEITSTNKPTGYFAGAEEFNTIVQSNLSYVEFIYGGFASVEQSALRQLAHDPYSFLKPAADQWAFIPKVAAGGPTYSLTPETGTFSYSGGSVSLSHNKSITPETGVYSYAGGAVSLHHNKSITPDTGTFSYTGGAVDLVYTPSGGPTYSLIPETGVFSYSGGNVSLLLHRKLTPETATFSYSGGDVSLLLHRQITPGSGTFTMTGGAVSLIAHRALTPETGVFSYTGGAVVLDYSASVTPTTPSARTLSVNVYGRTLTVNTAGRTLTADEQNRVHYGSV